MSENKLSRYADASVVTAAAAVGVWFFLRYAVGIILPALIALAVSALLRPAARHLGRHSRGGVRLIGGLLVFLTLFGTVYALCSVGGKLIGELTSFIGNTMRDLERDDNMIRRAIDYVGNIRERIPLISRLDKSGHGGISDGIYEAILAAARDGAAKLSSSVTSFAAGCLCAMPDAIFALAVSVISMFYLTMDYDGVRRSIGELLPERTHKRVSKIWHSVSKAASGYIRAYLILMLLTFGELFLGFAVLRIKYACLMALIVAVIDFLPGLGVGTVLIPWSVILLIGGDTRRAIGMLVLFGIMYVVRQFAEPRLVGGFIGIHPFLSLISAYAGYRLAGIAGMVFAPMLLCLWKLIAAADTDVSESTST